MWRILLFDVALKVEFWGYFVAILKISSLVLSVRRKLFVASNIIPWGYLMKSKVFLHVVVNALLAVIICAVTVVGLSGATTNVFGNTEIDPVYRGSGEKVALMINVYWGTEYLDEMLSVFELYNVTTTFFVGGYWVSQNPEMLKKICDQGHEIGNHGYFHKQHGKLTYEENVNEILTCGKLVFELCGKMPSLFAPPSGDFCSDTLRAAKDCGCKTVMWSRDTIDWRDKDSELVYTRATKNVSGGELILMHPTAHTVEALPRIIEYFLNNNLQPSAVSEVIG